MANQENIAYLTKSQMIVLYYKCKEGATHAEIAGKIGRDVKTVQFHMTNIYTVLEIRKPGKSKEAMESELNNEIAPIIREMFRTIDDVKIWVPRARNQGQEEEPDLAEEIDEPPYSPPPSVVAVLSKRKAENRPGSLEILQTPPPPVRTRNWWPIAGVAVISLGVLIFLLLKGSPVPTPIPTEPAASPAPPMPSSTAALPDPTEAPTGTSIPPTAGTPPIQLMISPKDGMVIIHIPAGEFKMGSSRVEDPQALDEEIPQHIVQLDDYWIDKMEVSNAQYALCVEEGVCTKPARSNSIHRESYYDNSEYADYPVLLVSWSQAAAYCAWAGRRLPTEAEWEKAARGPDGRIYPWGNAFDGTLLNYCDSECWNGWKDNSFNDGYYDTAPVGEYPGGASVYGVLGLSGNVYEWVADWFAPYGPDRQTNPTGPDTGQEKIIRGGSWGDDRAHIRAAIRSHLNGESWLDFIGFRCAQDP